MIQVGSAKAEKGQKTKGFLKVKIAHVVDFFSELEVFEAKEDSFIILGCIGPIVHTGDTFSVIRTEWHETETESAFVGRSFLILYWGLCLSDSEQCWIIGNMKGG